MTSDEPTSVPEPSTRRRRWWPSALLGMLSLLLLASGLWLLTEPLVYDAIDCDAYPDVCEQNAREDRRQQERERNIAIVAFVGSAAAMGYAVRRLRRR